VGLLAPLRNYIDTLVHTSAQQDALTSARHRVFIAPRLLIGLFVFAAFPLYVALRGVPSVPEALMFGWLVTLIAIGIALGVEALARTSFRLRYCEEDRYRLLARNMTDVITRHDRNGAVLFVSPAAKLLLGTEIKNLHGHGLFDRVHVADRPAYLTALADAAALGGSRSVEFRVRRGGPTESADFIWIDMRCRALDQAIEEELAAPEREVVAVMRDITQRKQEEQTIDLARAEAERANAAKSRFLATMSHELRTPLNAVIGFSEMLCKEDSMMIDAARRVEYAQLINDQGRHLLSVVNGILDMSKIETGNFEITPEPFSPRQVIDDCCGLLALKARESEIELVTALAGDLPDIVADKRALNQIMLNLVSNAIKFTERGGRITVSARHEAGLFAVTVADTGVGIDSEDMARIGDPFFQARSSYDRRHDGTGLGLSIVKGLVALHGGDIAIASLIGEGTSITIRLPVDCESARRSGGLARIGAAGSRATAAAAECPADNRVKIRA